MLAMLTSRNLSIFPRNDGNEVVIGLLLTNSLLSDFKLAKLGGISPCRLFRDKWRNLRFASCPIELGIDWLNRFCERSSLIRDERLEIADGIGPLRFLPDRLLGC